MSEKNGIKITKFKNLNGVVIVSFIENKREFAHSQEHSITSKDKPLDVLEEALANMSKHAITILEEPKDAKMTVTGFSLKYSKDENEDDYFSNVVLTCVKHLQKGAGSSAMNSPQRHELNSSEETLFPEGMAEDLRTLVYHVTAYYNGERSHTQEDMFKDGTVMNETEAELDTIQRKYGLKPATIGFNHVTYGFKIPSDSGMHVDGVSADEYLFVAAQDGKKMDSKVKNYDNYIGSENDTEDHELRYYYFIPLEEVEPEAEENLSMENTGQ